MTCKWFPLASYIASGICVRDLCWLLKLCSFPFLLYRTTLTVRTLRYARDYRTIQTQENLGSNRFYFIEIENTNEVPGEHTYPNNTEIVWQIEIPKDHVAVVTLTSISLEKPKDGSCINDFVSVYTDEEVPDKFCSKLEQIRQVKPEGSKRLTIKFQSNEANNSGRFAGAVWILHNSSKWSMYILLQ